MKPESNLDRDITGKCVGECKNLALEGMEKRQKEIEKENIEEPDYFPSVKGAEKRNEQPGWLGGHV